MGASAGFKVLTPRSTAAGCDSSQAKYRDAAKKEASSCEYHQLAETLETLHAKEASQLQSEVAPHNLKGPQPGNSYLIILSYLWFFPPPQLKYRGESRKDLSTNLYSTLAETPETKLARAISELHSQVGQQGALPPLQGQGVGCGPLKACTAPCWRVVGFALQVHTKNKS